MDQEDTFIVSRETMEIFEKFEKIIRKWNSAIPLVQEKTLDVFYQRHIQDSLQIANYIKKDDNVLDIGSGGGFPGIVLAILGYKNITLVDSNRKKTFFLEETSRQLNLKPIILCERVENITGNYNIITARAFSNLDTLLGLIKSVSRETKTKGIFLKGASYQEEILEAEKKWVFEYKAIKSITEENSRIIVINNLRRKD